MATMDLKAFCKKFKAYEKKGERAHGVERAFGRGGQCD